MSKLSNKAIIGITIVLSLLFVFFYPRLIIGMLGKSDPWTSYLYQYGLGLVVFLIGLMLVVKTGALKFGRGHDSFWFKWMIAGFIIYSSVHAIWIVLALTLPFKG